jgi:hypothetical protein
MELAIAVVVAEGNGTLCHPYQRAPFQMVRVMALASGAGHWQGVGNGQGAHLSRLDQGQAQVLL